MNNTNSSAKFQFSGIADRSLGPSFSAIQFGTDLAVADFPLV